MYGDGVTVLMRYTLRLLSFQQFERAAALVCACEIIRKEEHIPGGEIGIGLWAGKALTPNKLEMAKKILDGGSDPDSEGSNPAQITKCPWCGADILKGHYDVQEKQKRMLIKCPGRKCAFRDGLPIYLIDEEIYAHRPTYMIATVDKFAQVALNEETSSIFGLDTGRKPPELIIQDELHLISGPLGSMVGHYETMIHELCSYNSDEGIIQPKIIASTATISRAAEQCHALYGCGTDHVRQFPPSGLEAGDSFFAVENKAAAGRKYVGIAAPAASSIATTMIRLYASLLYAGKAIEVEKESMRDPYWTNVGYFNSIRELGQTETWIHADIDEYLHVIYLRRYEDKEEGYKNNRRYIVSDRELTSRISSDRIPAVLQEMSIRYPSEEEHKKPVDICLATNMISVGVDLPRLGLMTVAGQPKTTSEYIQATSRVGRSSDAPGLIFTVYNPGKPRDRSHYEHFVSYHSTLNFIDHLSLHPIY